MALLALFGCLVLAIWAYMTLWFLLARLLQRSDAVDTAWGLGFVVVVWLAWLIASRHADIHLLAVGLVSLWGLRLAVHITQRNRKKTEDYRYVRYWEKWGDNYWLRAYLRIFLTQGLLVLIISTPLVGIMHSQHVDSSLVAVTGVIVWAAGIVFEAEADNELARFIKTKKPGQIMTKGVWRYSRHPNYFGEVIAWWGAAIVALSMGQWWGIIGAITITILITKVSGIPPLERHYVGNKNFEAYKRRTSIFVPLPPRKI